MFYLMFTIRWTNEVRGDFSMWNIYWHVLEGKSTRLSWREKVRRSLMPSCCLYVFGSQALFAAAPLLMKAVWRKEEKQWQFNTQLSLMRWMELCGWILFNNTSSRRLSLGLLEFFLHRFFTVNKVYIRCKLRHLRSFWPVLFLRYRASLASLSGLPISKFLANFSRLPSYSWRTLAAPSLGTYDLDIP